MGKSKFINELVNATENFCAIEGSSELMKKLKIKAGDYEKLRRFNNETKNDVLNKIILTAHKKYGNSLSKNAVMDAHILNIKDGTMVQVMDSNMIKMFTAVIYLHTKTTNILRRIEEDNSIRDRSIFGRTKECDKTKVLKVYINEFEEILEKECLIADTLLKKIPHFNNKTQLALQVFGVLHKKILKRQGS